MINALSYTDLATAGRCMMKFKYRNVYRIQRKRRSVGTYEGSVGHELLKAFFLSLQKTGDWDSGLQAMYLATSELIDKDSELLFTDEQANQFDMVTDMADVVLRYLEQHQDEILTWEILHVEEQFFIQLEGGEFVTFTPDLVIRDQNGFVWIIDHKTTTTLPSGLPFADLQAVTYSAGVKELYPEFKGFIFNYLRKKLPSEPRLAKTGDKRVAYLKTIDTTFEILRDFLQQEAPDLLDDPDHRARLAELRERDSFFYQEQLYIKDEQIQAALQDTQALYDAAVRATDDDVYYRVYLNRGAGYQSCDSCEFSSICRAELLGQNVEMVLENEYDDRDDSHKEYEEA